MRVKPELHPNTRSRLAVAPLLAVALWLVGCGGSGAGLSRAPPTTPATVAAPPPASQVPVSNDPIDPLLIQNVRLVLALGDGRPVVGAVLRLGGGPVPMDATTDASGIAALSPVPTGTYRVELVALPPDTEPTDAPGSVRIGVLSPRTIDLRARVHLQPGPALLFGDSDSTGRGDAHHTVDRLLENDPELAALLGRALVFDNRADGNTPAHDTGVEQVRVGLADHPAAALALVRFGLNDAHQYLFSGGAPARARFEAAYVEIVDALLDAGVLPVLYTVSLEDSDVHRVGDSIANRVIRELALRDGLPLVESGLDAREQRALFDADGTHLNDRGHAELAARTLDELIAYFTHVPAP